METLNIKTEKILSHSSSPFCGASTKLCIPSDVVDTHVLCAENRALGRLRTNKWRQEIESAVTTLLQERLQ